MRGTTRSSGAKVHRSLQDSDDSEEDWQQQQQRAGGGGAGRIPLQPPRDPSLYETEEEWKVCSIIAQRYKMIKLIQMELQLQHEAEKTDTLHHLPLILVALPPLGAIVHG